MKWIVVLSLYCMCVIKCLAMSPAELEDFSIFLQETSQLDQNVKSNIPNEYDDDASVSDHAWEESGKFEGDLILNDRQRRMIVASVAEGLARNGISDTTKRWPNNEVIYYIQTEHFSNDQIQAIQNGIDDLARASCVKFTPYKKGDRDAVVIQGSRRGCFSQVGYQGGYQILNLSSRHPAGRGCFRHGTVVHEMLHTLGFYHMQSSPDRDDYIDVFWPNIIKNARHNFRKYNSFSVSDYGVGYDYDSVLHYSRKAFSVNGKDTLVPKQLGATIGQRIGLSEKDVEKLNKMYCDIDSDQPDSNDSIQKLHKKKHKNKPFEGLGLGYQKGKTVVIKLPKAYQFQDSPQYTTFDYFSKPEGQNPIIQGARAREEMIINNFKIPNRTIMRDHPPIEALKQYHTPTDDVLVKSYNEKQNTEGTLSDHFGDDLTEFYKLSLIKDPQTQVKQLNGDDYDGELYNFNEYLNRDEENPSKYTDFSHPNYSLKQSSGRYLPLAIHEANNSFKNSFSDEQNTPVREKWFNADEFKKNYRGDSPSSFDYR